MTYQLYKYQQKSLLGTISYEEMQQVITLSINESLLVNTLQKQLPLLVQYINDKGMFTAQLNIANLTISKAEPLFFKAFTEELASKLQIEARISA